MRKKSKKNNQTPLSKTYQNYGQERNLEEQHELGIEKYKPQKVAEQV